MQNSSGTCPWGECPHNVFGGGANYTASSPLSIDANDVISIDLTAYATKQYVDDAIAAIANLEEEEF